MVSTHFSLCGFVSVEFLPMEQKCNSQFFTETVLPSIEEKLAECRPKLRTPAVLLHVDNAKPHTSKMSIEKIEELGFILVLQPPYSPGLAPCDFFLFNYLKQHMEGKHFTREDHEIAAVREAFDKIPLQTFQNVMDDWQYRLRRCIQLGGEYLLQLKRKFKKYLIFGNFALTARTSGRPPISPTAEPYASEGITAARGTEPGKAAPVVNEEREYPQRRGLGKG
jgi:hypothetical protein